MNWKKFSEGIVAMFVGMGLAGVAAAIGEAAGAFALALANNEDVKRVVAKLRAQLLWHNCLNYADLLDQTEGALWAVNEVYNDEVALANQPAPTPVPEPAP